MPESAYGPTNNCIGIGNELLARGHKVVFAAESSWAGKLSALGFGEDLVDLAPPPEDTGDGEQDAGQFWKDYIREISPEFQKSTSEQLETVTKPIWEALIDGAKYCEPALRDIVARVKPDVIIEDNVLTFPALRTSGVPFVRIVSCNPAEVPGDGVPPAFSGLAADSPATWDEYRKELRRTHQPMWDDFNAWVQQQGTGPLPDLEFLHPGDLNLYVFPEELDYVGTRPLDPTWHRIDSSVRETDVDIELPANFTDGSRPLIYFSLGSLGSADVALMNRILSVLAKLDVNVIVSMGPLHDEIVLGDNMFGAEFLPQTKLIPQVDLVITHGGNNTVTEAMHFGKPMILLPLFWDQYDNAQRVHEMGYGRRLATYAFTDEELIAAVNDLIGDTELRAKVEAAGRRIREKDGLRLAAELLERLAVQGRVPLTTDVINIREVVGAGEKKRKWGKR